MSISKLRAPFSWFGGKSKVAPIIWQGLGQVSNYIEPFAGSLATLLANPNIPKIETVNDLDCMLANFWRAVSIAPELVAEYADVPVNEADLHARHKWLISVVNDDFRQKMHDNIDFYDAKIAGWWIWGQCASVGNNWMQPKGLKALPLLSSAGGGIHGLRANIQEDFKKLQQRLRRVRVACGDWKRVITPGITYDNKSLSKNDITAIMLDPPYDANVRDKVYREDTDIFAEVAKWAIDNGDNPRLRIALCGYAGDHGIPSNWTEYAWKANGGMANIGSGKGTENAGKERIWFSPNCLPLE